MDYVINMYVDTLADNQIDRNDKIDSNDYLNKLITA